MTPAATPRSTRWLTTILPLPAGEGREEQGGQNADDGNDNQQFDECKTPALASTGQDGITLT
jgi:hypothetical protein